MKLSYQFSNLLGCAYRKGNLDFGRGDNMKLYTPVGNRVHIYDIKNNRSETLPCETNYNVECMSISPNNTMMIVIDEVGQALFINLMSKSIIHTYDFRKKVQSVSFSPNGKRFAITIDNSVVLYRTPGTTPEVNPFIVEKRFKIMHDTATCIDWSSDSRAICVGSKDMNTYVICTELCANLNIKPMGGLKDAVVGCFFMKDSLDFISLSELGEICIWKSDTKLTELIPGKRKRLINEDGLDGLSEEDEEDEEDEGDEKDEEKKSKKQKREPTKEKRYENVDQVFYTRTLKHSFKNLLNGSKTKTKDSGSNKPEDNNNNILIRLRACDYHKERSILVTAFENGTFYLHEMPSLNLMHSLSIEGQYIGTVKFNSIGEWVAVGCPKLGQLLVWEWLSEICILKQQGHFGITNCIDFSPDGMFLASGGEDGKVKIWDITSGNCFVTFTQHTSSVMDIAFRSNGQAIVTASLDGTVRAFDMIRYRNFKTFTAPERTSTQFYSVAIDFGGQTVCAGAKDTFEIYVWSMKTGMLINMLTGHEGPVGALTFSNFDNMLASGSWDHTVRFWNIFSKNVTGDIIALSSDALAISFRPDGQQIAIASLDGLITVWDVRTTIQLYTIEGLKDLGYSRKEGDKVTAKQSAIGKAFRTLCYTADGKYLLAGGQSKNICIFSVDDQLLLRRFEVTCNLSLDGTQEFLDRRRMTEFGSLSLTEEDDYGARQRIALPGALKGEFSSRAFKPEVRVNCVRFSPTGMSWIVASTEGILVYSLRSLIGDSFDPFELDPNVTPQRVNEMLERSKYREALLLALKLNNKALVQKVLESVPTKDKGETEAGSMEVDGHDSSDEEGDKQTNSLLDPSAQYNNHMTYICSTLPDKYVAYLVHYLSIFLEKSRHLEFYTIWAATLMKCQTYRIKQRSDLALRASLVALERSLARVTKLVDLMEHNQYGIKFLLDKSESQETMNIML